MKQETFIPTNITLDWLMNEFGEWNVQAGISFCKTEMDKIYKHLQSIKPKKPILKHDHIAKEAIQYAKDLEQYEMVELPAFQKVEKNMNKNYSDIESVITDFMHEASGLNKKVPAKYRSKVYAVAYEEGHSAGYYEVYNKLTQLVGIFED